jgi:hypothetical protein
MAGSMPLSLILVYEKTEKKKKWIFQMRALLNIRKVNVV